MRYFGRHIVVASVCMSFGIASSARSQALKQNLWTTNGEVSAVAKSGRSVFIGGNFSYVGPPTGGGVILNTSTGNRLGSLPRVNGEVRSVVADGTGGWFIGGIFTSVNGIARNNFAHVASDGTIDTLNPSPDGPVYTMVRSVDRLFIGGDFFTMRGQPRRSLASLTPSGILLPWNPNANGSVFALALSGQTLYVGGSFSVIGDSIRNSAAAFDTVSRLARPFNPNVAGTVNAIEIGGNGIYLGGSFTSVGGRTRNNLASVDFAGGVQGWTPSPNGIVHALRLNLNTLYVGGEFTAIAGVTRNRLAALSPFSVLALPWNPNANGAVRALSLLGTVMYIGGDFQTVGGVNRNHAAAFDTAGVGALQGWNPVPDTSVHALLALGASVFAGGSFTSVNGVFRNNVAAVNDSSGAATAFNPNVLGGAVQSMALSGNTLYIGGAFSTVGTAPRPNLAAIGLSTGLATGWNPAPDGPVYALDTQSGRIYVAGQFTTIAGVTRNRAAAIDSATGAASGWNPNLNDAALAIDAAGSTVYLGGQFSAVGVLTRNKIAAVDAVTGIPTPWDPNAGIDRSQFISALLAKGDVVYAGGRLSRVGGQDRNALAALDSATGNATSFNAQLGPFTTIDALAYANQNLYVGGRFDQGFRATAVGSDLIAVHPTTGAVRSWDPAVMGGVSALAVSDSTVYAGGSFQYVRNDMHRFFGGFADSTLLMPVFASSRASLDFGGVRVGRSRTDSTVVTNTGGGKPLTISSATSNNMRFTISPPNATLQQGERRAFRVTFSPTAQGAQAASLSLVFNTPASPFTLPALGNGIAPAFSISSTSLVFGNVVIGTVRTDSLRVTNSGSDTLRISNVSSTNARFGVDSTTAVIPPGGSKRFLIAFSPDSAVQRSGDIVFTHDAAGTPTTVSVSGTGVAPGFSPQPASVNFRNVLVGATRSDSIVVTNRGSSLLTITSVTAFPTAFTVLPPSASLLPNESRTFVVSFTPNAALPFSGNVTFVHNAAASPTIVPLFGVGVVPVFEVTPLLVNFRNVVVNTTGLDSSVVVRNGGGAQLSVLSAATSSGEFAVTPRTALIDSGGSRRFTVSFTPSSGGDKNAQIVFIHNAAGSPDTVVVVGRGVTSTFGVSPPSLVYGDVRVGASRTDSLTVRNDGGDTIRIASAATGNTQFVVVPTSTNVPPGGDVRFSVRFSPTTVGDIVSTVTFTHTAVGSPTSVPVSGRGLGAVIALSRSSLQFGNVRIGTFRQDTLTVRNNGNDTLVISTASVTDGRFSVFPLGARIAPFANRVFTITCTPTAVGTLAASLRFDHSGFGSPSTIALSVVGTSPALLLSPPSLSFGAVPVGNSANRSVQLKNIGSAPLTVDSVRIHGDSASEFSLTGSSGPFGPFGAGDSIPVFLRFSPRTPGENKSALLVVSGDMPTSPDTVALNGIGREAAVQVVLSGDSVVGGRVRLSASSPIGFPVVRAVLFYRVTGRRPYDSLDLTFSGASYLGDFPPNVVTPRGIEYFVRLSGPQGTISSPEGDPVNAPAVFRVNVPQLLSPQRFSPREYKMVSIPLELSDSTLASQLADDLGPYNPIQWRLFRWENSSNTEYPRIRKSFVPGCAFWLITIGGQGFDARNGRSVSSNGSYPIRLDPGWNQIASPFAFPVAWGTIIKPGRVRLPFFYDGVEFVPNITTLNPWEGYFVLNDSSQSVSLFVPPVEAGPALARQAAEGFVVGERDYLLQFSAAAGGYRDSYNYVGLIDGSLIGEDQLDLPEPPMINDNLHVSVFEDGKNYVANFKPPASEGQTWELRVNASSAGQTVRISIAESGVLHPGFALYILDNDESAAVAVNDRAFFIRSPEKNRIRSFTIILGTESYAQQVSGGIPLQPLAYSLSQNYPNPFNPSTVIQYAIQKRSAVALEVFNIMGEKVKTLAHDERTAGTYSVVWDGTNDGGELVSSGVYVFRLHARPILGGRDEGEYQASRKLLLIR